MRFVLVALLIACSQGTPKKPDQKQTADPASTGAVSEAQFKAMHELPTSGPSKLDGQPIELAGTKAYLSLPKGPGPHPGIVVIHEWWGLNANIEHWADRLAAEGWAALAIDLYGGVVATDRDTAMKTMKAVDVAKAKATIHAALEMLGSDDRIKAPKRVVIGWCYGGGWSLQTALDEQNLDGTIMYYGHLEYDLDKLKAVKGRVLAVFGTKDESIPQQDVDKFEQTLKDAGVKAEVYRYDADHAFANPSNPKYDEKNAAAAWSHVVAFLTALRG